MDDLLEINKIQVLSSKDFTILDNDNIFLKSNKSGIIVFVNNDNKSKFVVDLINKYIKHTVCINVMLFNVESDHNFTEKYLKFLDTIPSIRSCIRGNISSEILHSISEHNIMCLLSENCNINS